jgi:hypothetical protein
MPRNNSKVRREQRHQDALLRSQNPGERLLAQIFGAYYSQDLAEKEEALALYEESNLSLAEIQSLKRGLAQSAAGEVVDLGSFQQYLED